MQERKYREWMGKRFPHHFLLRHQASDIWIGLGEVNNLEELQTRLQRLQVELYDDLERYIDRRPEFLTSLNPLDEDATAPEIARDMIRAAQVAGTGPMAAVAGTLAQYIAKEARRMGANEVVAENGGDLFLDCASDLVIALYAGESPFSHRIGLMVRVPEMPLSLCTSSGTVGHSFSFGKADAVVVKSRDGALADALATSICNQIGESQPMEKILEKYHKLDDIEGIVAVRRDQLAAVGCMELTKI
jgi:hypothetical protein